MEDRFKRQHGQALVFGIFVAGIAASLLYFVFYTGQLTAEKTKLVNAADAALYSAGQINTRTLNFLAYGNRVSAANTVAIAQLTSLNAFIDMYRSGGVPGAVDGDGNPIDPSPLFDGSYPQFDAQLRAMGEHLVPMHETLQLNGVLDTLTGLSDQRTIYGVRDAQFIAVRALREWRWAAMNDTLSTIYQEPKGAVIDPAALSDNWGDGVELVDWTSPNGSFLQLKTGDNRRRMRSLVTEIQRRDTYIGDPQHDASFERAWQLKSNSRYCPGRSDVLKRRGKTWLSNDEDPGTLHMPGTSGYARWTAEDELVEEYWVNSMFNPCATPLHRTVLWGRSSIGSGQSGEPGYAGIPDFFDLSPEQERLDNPSLFLSMRFIRPSAQLATSEQKSGRKATARLNHYTPEYAGPAQGLVAVSKVESYFRRDAEARLNTASGTEELPNLFNPYWHTRLANSDAEAQRARNIQGITFD